MKKYSLVAKKRTIIGRKVKKLRREGGLPATIYGKKLESVGVVVDQAAFTKVYQGAGETGLVELQLDGSPRPVLIHNVQKDPVTDGILHAEFYQVDLKEKVHTKVPVELVGQSPVVVGKQGVLLTILSEVEVEALPTDLPEKLSLDISKLEQVGQEFKVVDLKVPSGVTILTEANLPVVKLGELVTKEAEELAAAAAAAATEAQAAASGGGEATTAAAPETAKPSETATASTPEEKQTSKS